MAKVAERFDSTTLIPRIDAGNEKLVAELGAAAFRQEQTSCRRIVAVAMQRPSGLAVGFSISFFDARDLVLQQTFPIATILSLQFTCPLRVVSVDYPVQAEMRPLNRLEERAPAKLKMLGDRAREGRGQRPGFALQLALIRASRRRSV